MNSLIVILCVLLFARIVRGIQKDQYAENITWIPAPGVQNTERSLSDIVGICRDKDYQILYDERLGYPLQAITGTDTVTGFMWITRWNLEGQVAMRQLVTYDMETVCSETFRYDARGRLINYSHQGIYPNARGLIQYVYRCCLLPLYTNKFFAGIE